MTNTTLIETVVILGGMVTLTAALMSGHLSEAVYAGLMGTFMGYTIGRIFNRAQGKE